MQLEWEQTWQEFHLQGEIQTSQPWSLNWANNFPSKRDNVKMKAPLLQMKQKNNGKKGVES